MKTLLPDTKLFIDVVDQLLSEGHRARFRASGSSMVPAIHDGDVIIVERVQPVDVREGDILLYRHGGRALAHRVMAIRRSDIGETTVLTRGDRKAASDAPIAMDQILGRVVGIECRDDWRTKIWDQLRNFRMTLCATIGHTLSEIVIKRGRVSFLSSV